MCVVMYTLLSVTVVVFCGGERARREEKFPRLRARLVRQSENK